jgi:hypothetical protein
LTNLRIVQGDATNLASLFPGQTFDLVSARALVARRIQCSCGRCLGDQPDDVSPKAKVTQIVEAIRQVLAPGVGHLVSTEAWAGAADLWCWASTLAGVGFGIDWITSRSVPTGRHSWLMLVAQAVESPTETGLGDIVAFLVGTEFQQTKNAPTVTGYMAEALFHVLTIHGLIFGFQATRDAFVLRRELHRAGALVVSYDYTNGNERELRLWPRRFAAHLKSQLETEATDLQAQQWDVLRFIPTGDRPDAHEGPDTR